MSVLDRVRTARDTARANLDSLLEQIEESGATELSESQSANIAALESELATLDGRVEELVAIEERRTQAALVDQRLAAARPGGRETGSGITTADRPVRPTMSDLAALVPTSPLAAYGANGGEGTSSLRTEFGVISTKDINGKNLAPTQRISDALPPARPTPILDAIGYESVSSNAVEWVEYENDPQLAKVVLEGGVIAEADYKPVVRQGTLDKVGHTVPLTLEAISDVPRLQSVITGELVDGVRLAAEKEASAKIVAGVYTLVEKPKLEDAVRFAMATIQQKRWNPTHMLVNPLDLAAIDITLVEKTFAGFLANRSVWGLTAIPSFDVVEGTIYVCDPSAAWLFLDRQDAMVSITDSHSDEFLKDLWRIKATQRCKTVVRRPEAVCKAKVKAAS
ncbi:MAG: phage major capsid protein [Actinomycetes bacterium]